jgi:hypothetical protein
MAQIITRGFRIVKVYDLSDLGKDPVQLEQITEIGHDGGQETDSRTYEDSIVPNLKFRKSLTGNITIKGDIEKYVYPSYAATVRTDALFELDHYYLICFLGLNINASVAEMVYRRWIGQLTELPKESLKAGEVNEREIQLAVAIFGSVSYDFEKYYNATADGTPGPADATPQTDYNPLFSAVVPDTTKTLAAAEAVISATLINPE